MPRSDPHFKVHCTLARHPKTIRMFQDPMMLGCYVAVGVAMVVHFADRTDDQMVVGGQELREIFGTEQVSGAVQRAKKLAGMSPVEFLDPSCDPDAAQVRPGCAPVVAEVSSRCKRVWVLGLPNFAKKQWFGPRQSKERAPSASASATATKSKKKRESPPHENPGKPEAWKDMERLRTWAREKEPWANGELQELVLACFRHHQGRGTAIKRWYPTCQNWISRERRFREERERGHESELRKATRKLLERSRRRASDPDAGPPVRPLPEGR